MTRPADPFTTRPANRPRRLWERALFGGLVVIGIAGAAGLVATTGWAELRDQIARLTLAEGALLLLLSLANYLSRGLRWHLFARRLGLPTTLSQDLRHFLGGLAMVVTPGRLGELVRLRWLSRETGWSLARTAPLALVDRAADLAAMALILAAAGALAAGALSGALPVAGIALLAAVVATRPRVLTAAVTLLWRIAGRWPRVFARARTAARSLARFSAPGVLLPALLLGIAGWAAEGYAFHLLLGWLGAGITPGTAMAIFVFATLAGGLTGAPGGLGGAEAAMLALLAAAGVPLATALPATLIIRATTLWFALGLGALVFPFAERLSIRGGDALEAR